MCIASILMENLWNCKFRELCLNPSTWLPRSTCFRCLRNFVVSARLLRGAAQKSAAQQQSLLFEGLQWGGPWPFPQAWLVRNSRKNFGVFLTRWGMNHTIKSYHQFGIHFTISHWKISKWNETICDISLRNQDANVLQNNISQRMLSHWSQDVLPWVCAKVYI